jgi:uncharacterized protein (DUF433 family)
MATRGRDDLYYGIEIDWCRCDLLESVPGKVSGAWVIKGTRMPAQTVIDNYQPVEKAAAQLEWSGSMLRATAAV